MQFSPVMNERGQLKDSLRTRKYVKIVYERRCSLEISLENNMAMNEEANPTNSYP